MCDLRAVIAVTKQRFSEIVTQNDTLRTRLSSQGHIYEIDLAYGSKEGELNTGQLMSFVGRYLNAVRLGATALGASQVGIDNACDSCRFRNECHEAFGADEDNYGLYPLNTEFLENLMQARRNEVNPRRLLQVMRTVLVDEAGTLRKGAFPRQEWAESLLPRDPALKEAINLDFDVQNRLSREAEGARHRWLQTWWTREKNGVATIDERILTAFGLPALGIPPDAPTSRPVIEKPNTTGGGPGPIELWINGAELPAPIARNIRTHLRSAIVEALGGTSVLVAGDELERIFKRESIVIEGSAGGGHVGKAHKETFSRSSDTAPVLSYALAAESGGWDTDHDAGSLPAYFAEVHRRGVRVRNLVRVQREDWSSLVEVRTQTLALFGLVAGNAPDATVEGLLTGVVADLGEGNANAQEWFKPVLRAGALRRFSKEQAALLAFATGSKASSGSGRIAVDPLSLVPPLEKLAKSWSAPKQDGDVSPDLIGAVNRIDEAVEVAGRYLEDWKEEVARTVGEPSDVHNAVKQLAEAEHRASAAGVLSESFQLPPEMIHRAEPLVTDVQALLTGWDELSLGERVIEILKCPKDDLEALRTALRASIHALDSAIKGAERRAGTKAGKGVEKSTRSLIDCLSEFRETVEKARAHAG